MGVNISDLVDGKNIDIDDLSGKVLAIDAFNTLYKFLTTIRQRDGTPLMDSKGNITSHLSGLFFRTTNLLQKGIKPVYVFDGVPPKLKELERSRRRGIKEDAMNKYEVAKKAHDIDDMKKYAARTSILTKEMVADSKSLLRAMGVPVVEAPSEGEAQAAFMVHKKDAYAVVSQDYDSFLFGADVVIQNLAITQKKKVTNKLAYETVKPVIVRLSDVLNHLGIDRSQLIALSMLVGTDYNIGGIKGIGPKNALKLVKHHKNDFNSLFSDVLWNDFFDYPWTDVFDLFFHMPVTHDYHLKWVIPNVSKINEILVLDHDFSSDRISRSLDFLSEESEKLSQKGLSQWM